MRRLLLTMALLLVVPLCALWWLQDVPPWHAADALEVPAGLGAKLACSGHYLSGFDRAQNLLDLASYSSVNRLLVIDATAAPGRRAGLPLGPTKEARYHPGLGCSLVYPDGLDLYTLKVPEVSNPGAEPWPMGLAAPHRDPKLEQLLRDRLETDNRQGLNTRALLLVVDGQLRAEAYAQGIGERTPLLGWSMAKSVTAMLIGRLESQGKLQSVERDLFTSWSDDARARISVQQLLQMTSGLAFDENYIPGSDATRMLFLSPSASDVAMSSPLRHTPGAQFYYSSGTTNLLARLVYDRLGSSTQAMIDFFHREFVQPLRLGGTTFEVDASGVYVGSSYLYAPARDWARFGYLLLNGGAINGQQVLEEEWVARAVAPNDSENDRRYGYQLWLNGGGEELRWPSLEPDSYAMKGNRGQVVLMLPEARALIVRLGWNAGQYPIDEYFGPISAAL
ncbi:MAG: serine hydrolase [Pseudomonadota bacterium]